MFRNIAFAAIYVAVLVFLTAALARSADYGTAEEARATLDKAVAAVKADKAKALDMFNKGEGGLKDRDLYVFCANASDSVMTHKKASSWRTSKARRASRSGKRC